MNNLVVRLLTGIVFISAIIGAILWNQWAASLIFGGFMLLGIHEFTGLINKNTVYKIPRMLTLLVALLVFSGFIANFVGLVTNQVLAFSVILIAMISLISSIYADSTNAIQRSALTFFGWLYILIPFLLITQMCFTPRSKWEIIGMFILIWTNDSMAYATGRLIGKTKLFERISPKKTWEGTIGGIIFTLGAGFLWSFYVSELPLIFWIICSPLVAVAAIFGDLFESQIKRQLGVKDSGTILPGHGGILDRFDAALMAIPIFYGLWMIYH